VLAPSQYEKNVKIKPNSNDLVEFAVKLPGRAEGEYVYLPIDSKFPQEDYERLQAAQDSGSAEDVATAAKAVEKAIRAQAKLISDKYLHAPISTDFAIMYLPTEGLFAEVVRRPGLTSDLQNNYRVLVTGPTTLMSLLNSLQMGFKTLAIEKSASDVWKVLGAAKTEFNKYSVVLDKLAKQLETAQNTVSEAGVRTRAVSKSLSKVEELEVGISSAEILGLPLAGETEDNGFTSEED
jgi:DNA recombination protein RmuC